MRVNQIVNAIAALVFFAGLVLVPASVASAQKPVDASKLKRGDKLEYKWAFDWTPVEFIARDTFNRVKIRDLKTGREQSVSIDSVRLPAGAAKSKAGDAKTTAAHPDNPFATTDEKAAALKSRTWSDKSGKYKVEGQFVRVDGNDVVLLRADKKEINVPLDKLSDADRKYVSDYQAGKSLDGASDGPTDKVAGATQGGDSESGEQKLLPLTPTDLNSARLITVDGTPEWKYQPDPAANIVPLRDVRVALQKVDFFAIASNLLLLPQEKKAFVVFKSKHGPDATSFVQACDLQRGKLEGVAAFGFGELPIAISPDGKYVLSRTDQFHLGKKSELRLYGREGKKVNQIACWQPYNHHRSPFAKKGKAGDGFGEVSEDDSEANARPELWADADIEWAEFIDNNHLLTMGHGGEMAMWKVPEIEPLYVIKARLSQPAISPGRNYVAMAVQQGVAILNAKDGELAGLIPLASDNSSGSVAFRPDGKRLVLMQGGQWSRVRVWDLESREIVRDFGVKNVNNGWLTHATWTTDDFLLCGSTVIDLMRRIPIWRYTKLNDAWQFYGGRAWFVAEGLGRENKVLTSAVVPPKAAVEAVAKYKPEDLLVIRPGMEVEVDLQGGSSDDLNTAREAVLKRLNENDMRVVPQSKLRLVGRIEPGETKMVKYVFQKPTPFGAPRPFFGPSGGVPAGSQVSEQAVTEQVLSLSFEIDGKSVWKYEQRTTPPPSVTIPEGKTIEQVLAERMQQDAKSFGQIWVPSYVAELPGGENQQAAGATP